MPETPIERRTKNPTILTICCSQRAASLLVSAVAKFEAALNRRERAGGRAAGLALSQLAAAAPPGDPGLQTTLEVRQ